jgi:hypothetical protein
MEDFHSITGGWLGTYAYKGRAAGQKPVRFEATFTALGSEGRFTGTILDDGPLGEAGVTGAQDGRRVHFTKAYFRPSGYTETGPVLYEGTLSEDGRLLVGVWRLELPGHPSIQGVWDARRTWGAESETEALVEGAGALVGAL